DLFARSEDAPRCAAPKGGVAEFQPRALADPAIREALRSIQNRNDFAAAVVRFGRDAGFSFHEGDVDAFLRGPAAAGAPGGLPIALTVREGRAYADWIDIGDRRLIEPFFEDTVYRAMRHPYVCFSRRVAPLEAPPDACAPRGLIFHLSRCGSTLVAQMLA